MVRTLVTGATGTLGSKLLPRLREADHEVVAASRSPPGNDTTTEWVRMDLTDGTGLDEALLDTDIVIHAATAPMGDSKAVDVQGTKLLLQRAADAAVSNFVYVSIVGADEIPLSYYNHKIEAEEAVKDSPVPSTVVRATQFHSFVADLLGKISRLPVWPLPTAFKIQPIDAGEVATAIVDYATTVAAGRVPEVGGPEIRTLGSLVRAYRDARGLRRPVVRLPIPGSVAAGFRMGKATSPDRTVGTITWEQWLSNKYDT